MKNRRLDGFSVLVTRPRDQAADLVAAIEARGGTAIVFPSIEIRPRGRQAVERDAEQLQAPDITIFISRNAVRHGIDWSGGQLAAIGPTTAAEIEAFGAHVDICPSKGFDSEHLLAEDAFADVAGKTIRIIRGDAGRELLAETLIARGAKVQYLSAYCRELPNYTLAELKELEQRWRRGEVGAVVIMSVQSLDNLLTLLPDWCRERLPRTPLVTPAARVLKEALGRFPDCPAILAAGSSASEITDSLETLAGHQSGP